VGPAGLGQEPVAFRPAGQGLAAGHAWVLEHGRQVEAPHLAIGLHTLALGVEAEPSIGLLVRANADVTKGDSHGNFLLQEAP
jgi:hypothetical protein